MCDLIHAARTKYAWSEYALPLTSLPANESCTTRSRG